MRKAATFVGLALDLYLIIRAVAEPFVIVAGMRKLPPALRRGEGRVPRDVTEIGELASSQSGGRGRSSSDLLRRRTLPDR